MTLTCSLVNVVDNEQFSLVLINSDILKKNLYLKMSTISSGKQLWFKINQLGDKDVVLIKPKLFFKQNIILGKTY